MPGSVKPTRLVCPELLNQCTALPHKDWCVGWGQYPSVAHDMSDVPTPASTLKWERELEKTAGQALIHWLLRFHANATPLPAPPSWSLRKNARGAPTLVGALGQELCHVSLSHSRGAVVAALSRRPVGVDVEPCARAISYPKRLWHAEEARSHDVWHQLNLSGKSGFHLWLWVMKEAIAKTLGRGVAIFSALFIEPTAVPVQGGLRFRYRVDSINLPFSTGEIEVYVLKEYLMGVAVEHHFRPRES